LKRYAENILRGFLIQVTVDKHHFDSISPKK